jgi:hypothetical protein
MVLPTEAKYPVIYGICLCGDRIMPYVNPPKIRCHKPSQQGAVTLTGRDHYLGPWPPTERKPPADVQEAYDCLVAERLANSRKLAMAKQPRLTVNRLILAFWKHAE